MGRSSFRQGSWRRGAVALTVLVAATAAALGTAEPARAQQAADGQAAFARGDYAQAERLWRPLAERGDAAAQTGLGNLFAAGRGVAQDYAQAAAWFGKAADQGNPVAQHALAGLYLRGRGVVADEAEALRWYRRAAEQGYAAAQSSLGVLLEAGRGGPKDEAQAAQWYRRAALQGDAPAIANLAALIDEGRGGVARDPVLAGALFARAAAVAPQRQDIVSLAQAAHVRLNPQQRQEADALRARIADPTELAAVLGRTGGGTASAPAPPLAAGEVELVGQCRLATGELASGCPDRAVIVTSGPQPVLRIVDGPSRRVLAELGFDTAVRTPDGLGSANLNVVSLNGRPVGGSCNYSLRGPRPVPGASNPGVALVCGAYVPGSGGVPPRTLLSWGLALFADGDYERWAGALNDLRDRLNPAMSDAAIAAAQAEAQRQAAANPPRMQPAPPPPAPARPSDDPKAIFGLLVGARLPGIPACRDGQDMPKTQPWCIERDNSGKNSLANLLTERAESYRQAGASPLQIRINDEMFDTSMLFALPLLGNLPWIELWLTRDQTVQMLRLNTRLPAADAMTTLLTRKYGKPTRRDDTEWRSNQTGQVVRRTPNLRWNLPELAIDFESQSTGMLFNEPAPTGTLTIHVADFARRVVEIERQNAPPPKKGM